MNCYVISPTQPRCSTFLRPGRSAASSIWRRFYRRQHSVIQCAQRKSMSWEVFTCSNWRSSSGEAFRVRQFAERLRNVPCRSIRFGGRSRRAGRFVRRREALCRTTWRSLSTVARFGVHQSQDWTCCGNWSRVGDIRVEERDFRILASTVASEILLPYVGSERILVVHVDDVAKMLVSLLQAACPAHGVYNAVCESVIVSGLKHEVERLNSNVRVRLGEKFAGGQSSAAELEPISGGIRL